MIGFVNDNISTLTFQLNLLIIILHHIGGLAEKTGALHVGDRVLEIDNQDVSNVLLSEAISLLQSSNDKVLFKVSRNSSQINRNCKQYFSF